MKHYTRRDSATAALRKLGIGKADYTKFITAVDDGFDCDLEAAQASLKKPTKKSSSNRAETTKKAGAETIASVAREMIYDGKTNEEVWRVIQDRFKLDDNKRHYPAWFRAQIRRDAEKR